MPIYEYHCKKCDQTFEKIQKFSDEPLTVHEECGGEVEKLLSAPGFQFKGTGWYVTDYAKSGSSPATHTKTGESKSEAKTETKAESKPAPASTTSSSDSK